MAAAAVEDINNHLKVLESSRGALEARWSQTMFNDVRILQKKRIYVK